MKRKIFNISIILLGFLMFNGVCFAQKTDTIVHINGNILTGDFKKMTYGVVTWKMDGMGTISLEEPKINTIISSKTFEIKLKDGKLHFGSFKASKEKRTVIIVMKNEKMTVDINDIVEVYPIKNSFFQRLSGKVSLGANYSKASNVATLAFSGNFGYIKEKSTYGITWDTNDTYQGDTLSSQNSQYTLAWQRALNKSWYSDVAAGVSKNTQLGTDLRWTLNLTGIKDIVYDDWNRLFVAAGVSLAREIPIGDGKITNDLAGIFQIKWKVYKLTSPKVWVDADLSYLPYFTDWGRNRVQVTVNPSVSIFSNNFTVGLSFYYNYDSKPSVDATSDNDYGLNLQLAYSYN